MSMLPRRIAPTTPDLETQLAHARATGVQAGVQALNYRSHYRASYRALVQTLGALCEPTCDVSTARRIVRDFLQRHPAQLED